MNWKEQQLASFKSANTLTIKPYNPDLRTFEEVSPVWEVVVDDNVYSRGWNGQDTKWYRAAVKQASGEIDLNGTSFKVDFEALDDDSALNEKITAAYRQKYHGQDSLPRMISEEPTNATIQVIPVQ